MDQLALLVPVVAEQFGRVGSADGAVAAPHVIGGAELVATPANPLWMLGMEGSLGMRAEAALAVSCQSFVVGRSQNHVALRTYS